MTQAPEEYPLLEPFGITVVFGRTKPSTDGYDLIDPIVEVLVDIGLIADERLTDRAKELQDPNAGERYVVTSSLAIRHLHNEGGSWGDRPGRGSGQPDMLTSLIAPQEDARDAEHEIAKELAEDLKKRVEKAFNDRDTKAIEDVLGDRMVDHNVLLGGVDLRQRMARALEAFPDATFSIDQYIFQGNAAAWKWSITGTHSQEIMGIKPTGKKVTLSGLSAAVLKDARILQHSEFSDDQGLLAQLEAQTS